MAPRSQWVADLLAAREALDAIAPQLENLDRKIGDVSNRRLAPEISSPSSPQDGGVLGGQDGAIGGDGSRRPDGADGPGLVNRSAAGSVLGASPGAGAGGSPAGVSTGSGGGARGSRTMPGVEKVSRTFDALLLIYKANPDSQASQPVKRLMDTALQYMPWAEAEAAAREAYDKLEGGAFSASGAGVGGGPTKGGARWEIVQSGNGVDIGRTYVRPSMSAPAGQTGGGSLNNMTKGESAIVGALSNVTEELRKIRRNSESSGLSLRAGGLA